jgi:hypothetical protein
MERGEDDRRCADAQANRRNDRQRHHGRAQQTSKADAKVLPQVAERNAA